MTVGNRIKQRRIELGLTQSDLAERMGYSGKTSVCMAENCGDNITTTKVRKFAEALGVSFRYLMGYEDDDGQPTPMGHLVDSYVLNSKKEELFSIYEGLTPEKQAAFESYLEFLQSQA